MASREQFNNYRFLNCFPPVVITNADTAQIGAIIDTQGFGSCLFLVHTGTLTDANATFTVLIEDGNDPGLTDAAAVADVFLEPLEADVNFDFSNDLEVRRIAYRGPKRYVRMTVTPSGNDSGSAPLAGSVMLGNASRLPVAGNV